MLPCRREAQTVKKLAKVMKEKHRYDWSSKTLVGAEEVSNGLDVRV